MATHSTGSVIGMTAAYVAACAAPMAIALVGPLPAGRGFWTEFGVALGFAGAGMMGAQFALTARVPALSRRIGQDTLLQVHRVAGIVATVLVLAHPAVLIAAEAGFAEFFDPRVNAPRAAALSTATLALLLLVGLSMMRSRLRIPYECWRTTHAALAALVMLIATAHVVMVAHYSRPWWRGAALVAVLGAPLGLLGWVRIVRPLAARSRPYRVAEVRRHREGVWTVALEPVGHESPAFEPGQFAWVTFGGSPLALRQHPFTIASSAERRDRIEFTIKALGDFTSTIGSIPVGSSAFVEGPAGSFGLPRGAPGAVLIAGGIGITPMASILRTMHDRGDPRPITLIYATRTLETADLADALGALGDRLDLRVVHVLEDPPPGWEGPTGRITRDLLARIIAPEALRTHSVLICGPDPMMDAAENAALALGVGRGRIHAERFSVV